MRIDVWADLVCPFCHVGRRRLDLALEQFEHGDQFDVIWHSFQLDRNAPAVSDRPVIDQVADKYGVSHEHMAAEAAEVGLDFQWEQLRGGNSYDAHRLIHFARAQGREREVTDRIMRGWYSQGAALGDRDTLTALAVEAGVDERAVRELLSGDEFGIDVRTDEAMAAQLGITAVPTFVFDQKYAVQGAQPVEIIVNALRHTWEDQGNPATPAPSDGCGGGCCGGGCGSAEGEGVEATGGCGEGACGDLCGTGAHAH